MSFISHLHKKTNYASSGWHESRVLPGVRYATRRFSLLRHIELTGRVRELLLQHDFLSAGNTANQLEAALSELLVRRLYIEWGLKEIDGLLIDGKPADIESLVAEGPEALANEIVETIRSEIELSAEERKNS